MKRNALAKTGVTSVDEYIALQPPALQSILGRVRRSVRKALPEAEEVNSYEPAYKLRGVRELCE